LSAAHLSFWGLPPSPGAGQQGAFQLLQNAGLIVYALAYPVMFALPLAGRQRKVVRPPFWLQAASVSGFAMTVMFVVLSLFPIIDVPNPWLFTIKVGGFTLACQLVATGLFYSHQRANGPARWQKWRRRGKQMYTSLTGPCRRTATG
jgi:hypothetical protein